MLRGVKNTLDPPACGAPVKKVLTFQATAPTHSCSALGCSSPGFQAVWVGGPAAGSMLAKASTVMDGLPGSVFDTQPPAKSAPLGP